MAEMRESSDTSLNDVLVTAFDDNYDSDDLSFSAEELGQAVVTDTDWTTETILNQIRRGNFKLNPNFQRRDAWNQKRKSLFIESLMLGLPIPQLVLAEAPGRKGTFLVLDGKQRLLALQQFAAGSTLAISEGEDAEGFALAGLEVLKHLNGKTLAEIEDDARESEVLSSFLNQTIRTVVVRNWPNEDYLHTVFLRLNTGSVQLSPQELRQALHPGPFTKFLDEFSAESKSLQKALGNKGPDFRMRDVELTLRYYAVDYSIEKYQGNLKKFLDDTAKDLNQRWKVESGQILDRARELEKAIDATIAIFGADAFRSWSREKGSFQGRFNRAVFDAMTFHFKDPDLRDLALSRKSEVKDAFRKLAESDQSFVDSISSTTKTQNAFVVRISRWGQALSEALGGEEVQTLRIAGGGIVVDRDVA